MGKMGIAAGIAGAAIAGWQLGKQIDDLFGLSNKISDFAIDQFGDQAQADIDTGFLRERLDKFQSSTAAGQVGEQGGGLNTAAQKLRNARSLVAGAKESGAINQFTGQVDPVAAGAVLTKTTGGFKGFAEGSSFGPLAPDDPKLIALQDALKLVQEEAKLRKAGVVNVVVSFDESAQRFVARKSGNDTDKRRAP